MSTVTEADRALAHSLAREIDLHYADSDAQAIARAIATAREAGERAGADEVLAAIKHEREARDESDNLYWGLELAEEIAEAIAARRRT